MFTSICTWLRENKHATRILAALLGVLMVVGMSTAVAKAAGPSMVDDAFALMGTTQEGYFPWCFEQIRVGLKAMDEGMATFDVHTDLEGLFNDTVKDTFDYFEGVENEEDALSRLESFVGTLNISNADDAGRMLEAGDN